KAKPGVRGVINKPLPTRGQDPLESRVVSSCWQPARTVLGQQGRLTKGQASLPLCQPGFSVAKRWSLTKGKEDKELRSPQRRLCHLANTHVQPTLRWRWKWRLGAAAVCYVFSPAPDRCLFDPPPGTWAAAKAEDTPALPCSPFSLVSGCSV